MMRSFIAKTAVAFLLVAGCLATAAVPRGAKEGGDITTQTTANGARIVFDWKSRSKVPFKPESKGNQVLLHFEEPVDLKWQEALNDLKPYLEEVETSNNNKTVVLTLSCPVQASKFLLYNRNGVEFGKNGLELQRMTAATPKQTLQSYAKTPKPLPVKIASAPKKQKTLPAAVAQKKPAPVEQEIASDVDAFASLEPAASEPQPVTQNQTPVTLLANAPIEDNKNSDVPVEAVAPVASALTPAPSVVNVPVANQPELNVPAAVAAPVVSSPTPVQSVANVPVAPPTELDVPAAVAVASETQKNIIPVLPKLESEPLSLAIENGLPGLSPSAGGEHAATPVDEKAKPEEKKAEVIALPLLADDPIAVFIKDKTLWIVSDPSAKLTEQSFKNVNKDLHYPVQTVPAQEGTVLTLTLDNPLFPSIIKQPDGKVQLELSEAPVPLEHIFQPNVLEEGEKNSLAIDTAKTGAIIKTSDPATGEAMSIVTIAATASGVNMPWAFVEFSLPPTAQGIVVQQVADDVKVVPGKDSIDISTTKGLAVSPELQKKIEEAKADIEAGKTAPVFFPYQRWKLDDEKKFVSTQLKLTHAMMSDNSDDANNARLRLLGLYLTEGMFAEANGMANEILRNSYKFYVEHNVSALRGAANFFRYRMDEAQRDFSAPELAGQPETAMWLALIGEMTGENKGSFSFKDNYDSTIRHYPPVFIQKMAIIAGDKSINRKDYDNATAIFAILGKEGIDEPVKKYMDFMRAKILSETGNEEEAAKIWERQSSEVNDRLIRARAEFSLVNMYLKEEKIPIEDAVKRLEKLRIVWRGDGLELNILSLLGHLYVEQKDYARALRAWRDIVAYYSEVPDAITTARKMEEIFVKLYNKGVADDMPPLTALSLFYEFRDLVPTGSEGDLMIRNLAERLVKIDLLDRASQLLSHQIRNRLQGTERSRVGARLAEIYLMNRQPKQALEILKTTGYGDLTPELQLQRIRLTAQALAQQGQLDKAIDVLSSDTSADGNLLRLSVYWTNWDWPNVVAMAEEILSNRNDPSAALTLQESEVLLKLATAYVYEHDSGQIQYLRDYFTPLLKNNPNKNSFLFITSESGSIDYTNLSNLDTDIKTVKGFIDTSRKEALDKTTAPAEPAPAPAEPAAPLASATPEASKAVN